MDNTQQLDLNSLSNVDKNILAFSSSIIEQMEECNQFLYTVIQTLLSKDFTFKVSVNTETNTAIASIQLTNIPEKVTEQKVFSKEYDSRILGSPVVPASIKLNKILIDTINDLLKQFNV